jgi:ATPase subunit of ABC transporter with duplicated ATPase domains
MQLRSFVIMSAFITLSDIAYSTPDGRPLFSDINLSFAAEKTGLIGRNGVGKSTLLKLISRELSPQSGAVSVRGKIGVLRQVVQNKSDESIANLFSATESLALIHRAEMGQAAAEDLLDVDWTLPQRIATALYRVGLDVLPETKLALLSGGQRTRARLAALICEEPEFLLLDEPTNNLDKAGRVAVLDLLSAWRGGAIVVSHDRELLETMDAIVELSSLGARRYGGNWTAYRECKAVELEAARRDLAEAEKRSEQVTRAVQRTAERKTRKDNAGKKKVAKGGLPRIVMGAWKDRSEGTGGNNARGAEMRRVEALEDVATARRRIEVIDPVTVALPRTGLPTGKLVLEVEGMSAGYEPDQPVIRNLSFTMTGPERLAITGPNGSGKTTILKVVTGALQPWSGAVRVMVGFAALDQSISLLDPSKSILDNFKALNPESDDNACRAALARFMFRDEAALAHVSALSGGELIRAGLACILGGATPPQLLILDEPTNHLDLRSLEAVESGLKAYDGALLAVSHDETFLKSIGISRRVELE